MELIMACLPTPGLGMHFTINFIWFNVLEKFRHIGSKTSCGQHWRQFRGISHRESRLSPGASAVVGEKMASRPPGQAGACSHIVVGEEMASGPPQSEDVPSDVYLDGRSIVFPAISAEFL
jgi:hypothetical protein